MSRHWFRTCASASACCCGASVHGYRSRHARDKHRLDVRSLHAGRRPAASASAGQIPGRSLQRLRSRKKRRPQSLDHSHEFYERLRPRSSVPQPSGILDHCFIRRQPVRRCRHAIASGANSYWGTTSTSSRWRGGWADPEFRGRSDARARPVLVLSYAFWRRRFAGARRMWSGAGVCQSALPLLWWVWQAGLLGPSQALGRTSGRR